MIKDLNEDLSTHKFKIHAIIIPHKFQDFNPKKVFENFNKNTFRYDSIGIKVNLEIKESNPPTDLNTIDDVRNLSTIPSIVDEEPGKIKIEYENLFIQYNSLLKLNEEMNKKIKDAKDFCNIYKR